jgi:hypothetical protein
VRRARENKISRLLITGRLRRARDVHIPSAAFAPLVHRQICKSARVAMCTISRRKAAPGPGTHTARRGPDNAKKSLTQRHRHYRYHTIALIRAARWVQNRPDRAVYSILKARTHGRSAFAIINKKCALRGGLVSGSRPSKWVFRRALGWWWRVCGASTGFIATTCTESVSFSLFSTQQLSRFCISAAVLPGSR